MVSSYVQCMHVYPHLITFESVDGFSLNYMNIMTLQTTSLSTNILQGKHPKLSVLIRKK
jgi:hypothetical protein